MLFYRTEEKKDKENERKKKRNKEKGSLTECNAVIEKFPLQQLNSLNNLNNNKLLYSIYAPIIPGCIFFHKHLTEKSGDRLQVQKHLDYISKILLYKCPLKVQ